MKQKIARPSESRRLFARWTKALGAAALVAVVCFVAVRALTPKVRDLGPDEIRARMEADELPLDTAIEQINRLDVRDRRALMRSPQADAYFQRLTPDARLKLLRETLDRGIRDQIERYRKMNKEERAAFIEEAQARQAGVRQEMENMSPGEREQMREMVSSTNIAEVVERAVQAYLKASSSEERAELAPLFDGALENVNRARGL
jgi:hypothetical protein